MSTLDVSQAQMEENRSSQVWGWWKPPRSSLCAEGMGINRSSHCGHTHLMVLSPEADTMYFRHKVHDVDSSSGGRQGPGAEWCRWQRPCPTLHGAVLGAGHHQPAAEAQVEHSPQATGCGLNCIQTSPVSHPGDPKKQNMKSTMLNYWDNQEETPELVPGPTISTNSKSRLGKWTSCTWWLGPDTMLKKGALWSNFFTCEEMFRWFQKGRLPRYSGMVFAGFVLVKWFKTSLGFKWAQDDSEKMAWWLGFKHEVLVTFGKPESIIYSLQTADQSWCLPNHHTRLFTRPLYGQSQHLQLL